MEYHFPGWTVYLNGISLPWVDSILKWNYHFPGWTVYLNFSGQTVYLFGIDPTYSNNIY
jgi:hypothetical protein